MANKKTANQSVLQNNIKKIQKTAKLINNQVAETVDVILKDSEKNRKQIASTVEKIQMKDSVQKIGKTVKNINTQVVETATEIFNDSVEKTKTWGNNVMTTTKKNIENIDASKNMTQVKSTIQNVNAATLETADEVVEVVAKSAEKWQGIAQKAIKGGLKLADKQQDIVFDTLDTVKGQLKKSANRLSKILK